MPTDRAQAELWSHFQTERPEVFEVSENRLNRLIRLAEKASNQRFLLNIGCGSGYLEKAAKKRKWDVISVDPDAKSIEQLKAQGIDARCGTIESLPVLPENRSVVIATEVFEHLVPETMEAGLREIQRVLAPGGVLIGTVPYRENLADNEVFCPQCKLKFHRWGHHQSFDVATMRSALEKYFSVRSVRPVFFAPWKAVDWKGGLSITARLVFSWFGVHGSTSNLLFVARKRQAAQ